MRRPRRRTHWPRILQSPPLHGRFLTKSGHTVALPASHTLGASFSGHIPRQLAITDSCLLEFPDRDGPSTPALLLIRTSTALVEGTVSRAYGLNGLKENLTSPGRCSASRRCSDGLAEIIILILVLIGSVPTWANRTWGYGPSGIVGLILITVIVLAPLGRP